MTLKVALVLEIFVGGSTTTAPETVLVRVTYAKLFESMSKLPLRVIAPILVLVAELPVRDGDALAFK